MKKIILFFFLLITVSVFSLTVELDLNQNYGNTPLDVNLTATIIYGVQTRTCTDLASCGTENNKPEEIQPCGSCTDGTIMNCTTAVNCPGTRTCSGGIWQNCVDDSSDNCPQDVNITVKQITPIQDINVIQNQLFTFTTSVTCNNGYCGDITATLDPQITLTIDQNIDDASTCGTAFFLSMFGYLGNNSGNSCSTGLKFNNVSIPSGSIINDANIELISRGNQDINTINLIIQSQTDDNPAVFSDLTEFNSRTRSTAFVEWNNVSPFNTFQTYTTPDLNSIIQEVVNNSNWTDGDSIVVFIADNESSPSALRLAIDSGDIWYGAGNEAKLNITYSLDPTFKGVIPMNSGNPFYTINQNPITCLDMNEGDICVNTWGVMPTGNLGNKYKFFVNYTPVNPVIAAQNTGDLYLTISSVENCSDNDLDGFNGFDAEFCSAGTDCQDLNPSVNPAQIEICGNGIDDNCNNEIDESCAACTENWDCSGWETCSSGVPPFVFNWDFEGNGVIDATTNSPDNSIIHTYTIGDYNPIIKVIDVITEEATDTKNLIVASSYGNVSPVAVSGGPYNAIPSENIVLDASASYDLDGTIDQYNWKITDKIGSPNCTPKNIITVNPTTIVSCSGIGTADVNLTVRDNGLPNREWNTNFTEIKVKEIQTSNLINIVKMTIEPEIVKAGNSIQIMTRIRSATNTPQDFNIYYLIKLNQADTNISALPALITAELINQNIDAFGQQDFILTITAAQLQTLKTGKNYWIYATAETSNIETNQTFNTRRANFSLNKNRIGEIQLPEINFISLIIIVFSVIMLLTKKQTIKKTKKQ